MKAMTDSVSGAVEIDKFSFENEDLWSKVSFGLSRGNLNDGSSG